MSGNPGPISETLLSELVLTLADLRASSPFTTISAEQVERRSRELGAAPDYSIILDREGGTEAEIRALLSQRPLCRPLIVDGKPYAAPPATP